MKTVLVLTNFGDATADYLCDQLDATNVPYRRIDTEKIPSHGCLEYSGSAPKLTIGDWSTTPDLISNVWLRRPFPLQISLEESAEANHAAWEWSEALEGFLAHIPFDRWMNHPTRNVLASHKIEQLTRAKSFGFRIPDTLLTQSLKKLETFCQEHSNGIVVKPLAGGYIERNEIGSDTLIYTSEVSLEDLSNGDLLGNCPTLFQEKIPKQCDVRIVFVDGQVSATKLIAKDSTGHQRLDIRRNNMTDVSYLPCVLSARQTALVSSLVSSYGLRFAALDFALNEQNELVFFEINPNGQWAWLDLQAQTNIARLFINSFTRNG